MDLFNEIDDLNDLFLTEKNTKLDSTVEGYEELQNRYSSLHEDYAKEIENSKKVEKCLVKCLKFYSKLCKKYEAQQKIITGLEETIKEKIISLEEAQRNEEKMKGLIQVYRTERAFYVGQSHSDLRKDKEILLDICCRLIGESVRNNNIRNLTNLLLRKFKKDLDDEKLNLLKKKNMKLKNESECEFVDVKSDFMDKIKDEVNLKAEEKYSADLGAVRVKRAEELEAKEDPLDLSMCPKSQESNTLRWEEESELESSLPSLEEVPPPTTEVEHPAAPLGSENTFNKSPEPIVQLQTDFHPFREENTKNDTTMDKGHLENEVAVPAELISSKSIFDISDSCLNENESKSGNTEQEIYFGFDESEEKIEKADDAEERKRKEKKKEKEDEEEEELFKILREMSSVKLPLPVGEIVEFSQVIKSKSCRMEKPDLPQKRSSEEEETPKCKKLRPEEEEEEEVEGRKEKDRRGGLLDSIMSAMSLQNEEFKAKVPDERSAEKVVVQEVPCKFSSLGTRTYSRRKVSKGASSKENSSEVRQSSRNNQSRQESVESFVMEEIKSFVSCPISSKDEADKNVKHCLSVLASKSEEVIAKCIVATVLENVDEVVETFERPAPPLTKTQHRLVVLLSVLRTLEPTSETISVTILSMISQKLFPDKFFWPDDSVEAATRFYAALCRARNDPKTLWKFCLQAMTDMRQRCPLLVFTVLKTWPDVLHDAATLKNNLLAITIVNIFLHMPKTEGLRNVNQGRKLLALKHLLMNFYQFKVEETIEGFAGRVVEGVRRGEAGAEKAAVLVARCRDAGWTLRHMVPGLRAGLGEWAEGKAEDGVGSKILSVMKQVCSILVQESAERIKVREIARNFAEILTSRKKNHALEVQLIEVLLQLKQYPEARNAIREWIPKSPIEDGLRNEIINASAENILRELKLNKRKESPRRKLKRLSKKSKGKKKKAKKRKTQVQSIGASS